MTDPSDDVARCWNCDARLEELLLPVSRHEYCPQCAEAVHCCRMCRHYAPARADQCDEERAEPPTDRTAANFCEYFSIGGAMPRGAAAGGTSRAQLDALFGGIDTASGDAGSAAGSAAGRDHEARQDQARARLDALFSRDEDSNKTD